MLALFRCLSSGQKYLLIYCLLGAGSFMPSMTHAADKDIPCEVRIEFSTDPVIGQVVNYALYIQVKNTKAQPITAISLLWLDEKGEIIGNSDADCRFESKALDVSHTGQCRRVVQTISNHLIQSFGQSVWTKIVNFELSTFKRIKFCRLVGYRYG